MASQGIRATIYLTGQISDRFTKRLSETEKQIGVIGRRLVTLRKRLTELRATTTKGFSTKEIEEYNRELRHTQREVDELDGELQKLHRNQNRFDTATRYWKQIAAIIGTSTLALYGFTRGIDELTTRYNALTRQASKAGLANTQLIQRSVFAGIQQGLSPEFSQQVFGEAYKELVLRLGEIAAGTQPALYQDLSAVGVDVRRLLREVERDPEYVFFESLRGVSRLKNRGRQAAALDFLSGGEYGEIFRRLARAPETVESYISDFQNAPTLGLPYENQVIRLTSLFDSFNYRVTLLKDSLYIGLLPVFESMIKPIESIVEGFRSWVNSNPDRLEAGSKGLADALKILGFVLKIALAPIKAFVSAILNLANSSPFAARATGFLVGIIGVSLVLAVTAAATAFTIGLIPAIKRSILANTIHNVLIQAAITRIKAWIVIIRVSLVPTLLLWAKNLWITTGGVSGLSTAIFTRAVPSVLAFGTAIKVALPWLIVIGGLLAALGITMLKTSQTTKGLTGDFNTYTNQLDKVTESQQNSLDAHRRYQEAIEKQNNMKLTFFERLDRALISIKIKLDQVSLASAKLERALTFGLSGNKSVAVFEQNIEDSKNKYADLVDRVNRDQPNTNSDTFTPQNRPSRPVYDSLGILDSTLVSPDQRTPVRIPLGHPDEPGRSTVNPSFTLPRAVPVQTPFNSLRYSRGAADPLPPDPSTTPTASPVPVSPPTNTIGEVNVYIEGQNDSQSTVEELLAIIGQYTTGFTGFR